MDNYLTMLNNAGPVAYIVIVVIVSLLAFWAHRILKSKKQDKVDKSLPVIGDIKHISQDTKITPKPTLETVTINNQAQTTAVNKLNHGDVKCLCFYKHKGVNVADFTTMDEAVGEMYQFDPSTPLQGSGYIVRINGKGEIEDYDPRQVEFVVDESPDFAWFAIHWEIVKQVFFVPVKWWQSTSMWFAAATLGILFITILIVVG